MARQKRCPQPQKRCPRRRRSERVRRCSRRQRVVPVASCSASSVLPLQPTERKPTSCVRARLPAPCSGGCRGGLLRRGCCSRDTIRAGRHESATRGSPSPRNVILFLSRIPGHGDDNHHRRISPAPAPRRRGAARHKRPGRPPRRRRRGDGRDRRAMRGSRRRRRAPGTPAAAASQASRWSRFVRAPSRCASAIF